MLFELVGGLKHDWIMTFPSYWECHHPNWRSHIFQRGRYTTNQDKIVPLKLNCFLNMAIFDIHRSPKMSLFRGLTEQSLPASSARHG